MCLYSIRATQYICKFILVISAYDSMDKGLAQLFGRVAKVAEGAGQKSQPGRVRQYNYRGMITPTSLLLDFGGSNELDNNESSYHEIIINS